MKKICGDEFREKKIILKLVLLLLMSELMNADIFFILMSFSIIIRVFKVGLIKKSIAINLILGLILIIGVTNGLINICLYKYDIRDYIRDLVRFLTPIIFIAYGVYLQIYRKINIRTIYISIVISSMIIEIRHLILLVFNINNILNGISIRGIGGNGSYITSIAIIILLFFKDADLFNKAKFKTNRTLILLFILTLFMLYLSRTHYLIVICGIIINLFINRKVNIIRIVKFIISACIIASICISIVPKNTMTQFVNKFSQSFTEISSKVSEWNEISINNNWRGYEVYRTKLLFNESNTYELLFGFGFGKRVDLNIEIYLGSEKFTNIPVLHNGYYYIVLKCGVVGLILYIIFLLYIMFSKYKYVINDNFDYKLLSTIGISVILTTYVVTGIYNRGSIFIFCLIIGSVICKDAKEIYREEKEDYEYAR